MSVYGNSRPQFTDLNGDPIQGGKLYIGLPDQDPVANPNTGVTDLDGNTISAIQTLSVEGVPTIPFEVDGDFSQAVFDSDGVEVTVYQIARTGGFLKESDLVGISGQGGDWNISVTYAKDNFVKGSNGRYYKSLTNNNLGNDPTVATTSWSRYAWPTLYNSNETYDIDDSAIGSDGGLYVSVVNGNVGNDPVTDTGGNWKADKATGRNLLYGNLRVNQRAVSGSVVLLAGAYGHDGFRAGSGGCTYTFATSSGVTTATISAGTLEQEIEGDNIVTGSHILTWTGTTTAQIDGGGFAVSGVTATLTGGTNAIVEFGTGTLALPQLEEGGIGTAFDMRPISEELEICWRYFYRLQSTSFSGVGAVQIVTVFNTVLTLPVEMRATPTATGSAGFRMSIQSGGAAFTDFSLSSVVTGTNYGIEIAMVNVAASMTIGRSGLAKCTAGTLDFSAEL